MPIWSGEVFGREAHRQYPVYFQAHAMENLRKRMPLEGYERELRYSLLDSLEQPRLVPKPGDGFLVESRFVGHRLGYFVATPLVDRVVMRTFLLMTMQGTPEAELLRRELKARRPDIEHVGLDRLETFPTGDIQNDPGLARILEECGCGPLLAQRNPDSLSEAVTGAAELIKKYFRIDESPRLFRS